MFKYANYPEFQNAILKIPLNSIVVLLKKPHEDIILLRNRASVNCLSLKELFCEQLIYFKISNWQQQLTM